MAIGRLICLSIILVLAFSGILFAQTDDYEAELKALERDILRLKEHIVNTQHLDKDRSDAAKESLALIQNLIDDASGYAEIDDYFEAQIQLELVKMTLAKAYQLASRSEVVEGRVISVDASTFTRIALQGKIPELVDRIADSGFNTIFIEILRDDGYVVYPSKYMVQYRDLEGTDPLGELVSLSKEQGIDVFPWQKVFFATANGTLGPILEDNPKWIALDRHLKEFDAYNHAWFSPAHPGSRELIFNYILEMWEKYDFAGCQLDYVRNAVNPLEDNDFSYDKASLDLFMTYYGFNPLDLPYPSAAIRTQPTYISGGFGAKWELWQTFREELVTSLIAKLTLAMKETKPNALISSGVATALWGGGTLQQALFRQQNWPLWVDLGMTQILSPLVYQNDVSVVEREVRNIQDLSQRKAIQYPSLGIHAIDRPYQLLEQIEAIRDLGEPGMRIFAYPHMNDEHFKLLKDGPFREKAYPPHRDLYKASFLLIEDLLIKVDSEKEYYVDLEIMKNRLEGALDGNDNRKITAARYTVTKLKRLEAEDCFAKAPLSRIQTMLSLYIDMNL